MGSTTHWKREVYLTRLPCYCSTVESYLMKGTIDPPHTRRVSLSLSLSLSLSFFRLLHRVCAVCRRFESFGDVSAAKFVVPISFFVCQKCFFNFFTKRGVTFFLAF